MSFEVRLSAEAVQDLNRLYSHLLERAETVEGFDRAQQAIDEIRAAVRGSLSRSPFSYRKAANSPLRREFVIPFGNSGYVALYDIYPDRVIVVAVRHQLEDDYA
jgi:plasmid stabilization system protein ParE